MTVVSLLDIFFCSILGIRSLPEHPLISNPYPILFPTPKHWRHGLEKYERFFQIYIIMYSRGHYIEILYHFDIWPQFRHRLH